MMYDTVMQLQADLKKAALIIEQLTGRGMNEDEGFVGRIKELSSEKTEESRTKVEEKP